MVSMADALTPNGGRRVTAFRHHESATAEVVWQRLADHFEVTATGPWGAATAAGHDAFSALVDVRKQLEDQDWFLAINGARRDTYPSGMGRAAGGLVVYELRLGERAGATVPTFADATPSSIGTVSEQKENFKRCWDGVR
jgi:hypothetical protein